MSLIETIAAASCGGTPDLPLGSVVARRANEPVRLSTAEKQAMLGVVAARLGDIFEALHIDYRNDHNTRDTPRRVARMLVEEVMRGRFADPPPVTSFENPAGFDDLIVTGPIAVVSTCAHHMMPISGEAFVGIIPNAQGRLPGLSKYDRIVDHFAGRLQIQEELVRQILEHLVQVARPRGAAVRISAVHMCKTHRGVRADRASRMVTTACFGELEAEPHKSRFLRECAALAQRRSCD